MKKEFENFVENIVKDGIKEFLNESSNFIKVLNNYGSAGDSLNKEYTNAVSRLRKEAHNVFSEMDEIFKRPNFSFDEMVYDTDQLTKSLKKYLDTQKPFYDLIKTVDSHNNVDDKKVTKEVNSIISSLRDISRGH